MNDFVPVTEFTPAATATNIIGRRHIFRPQFLALAESHRDLLAALKEARGRILANRIAEAGRLGMSYGEALKMFDDGIDPHLVNLDAAIARAENPDVL